MKPTRTSPADVRVRVAALPALALATLLGGCAPKPEPAWSGYAEGDYVYVAAPVAGRLATLPAARGQPVAAGALLFTLEGTAERAARAEVGARAAAAQAQAADAAKGRRGDELQVVQQQLQQASATAEAAAAELARQRALVSQGFISAARLDEVKAGAERARAQVAELEAALRVARLPAREDVQAAATATARAQQQALAQAEWQAGQTEQRAPAEGAVADTFFRPGEWVPAGRPVVSLLPRGAVKARYYVPEGEIAAVAPGQRVLLSCNGCGEAIAARVDFVASQPEFTPPVIYSNAQRARLVFRVEAHPVAAADAARLRPGQPLDVRRAPA
jgi:HlyD family secretion protein